MPEKLSIESKINNIEENIKIINDKIAKAAVKSERKFEDISLMAVTKTVEPIFINHAITQGISLIGENKVQEMLSKLPLITDSTVKKHLIGHLQTNKVQKIIDVVDMIESVDSIRLANEISKRAYKLSKNINVLIEVNIGKEVNKAGFMPEEIKESLYEISEMKNICVCGLMSVPPIAKEKKQAEAVFYSIRKLFIDIAEEKIDNISMDVLSMGMSSDYEIAIEQGSNHVRIGSGIFGARLY